MCGRYTLTILLEQIMADFGIEQSNIVSFSPKFNAAPDQMMPVIVSDGAELWLIELKWGFHTLWKSDPDSDQIMINARSETAAVKPAFREAFRRRRCIVPADGFYEWMSDPDTKRKQPMRVTVTDRPYYCMAGIYDGRILPNGQKASGYAVLTTEPNELVAGVHDRMPVILGVEDAKLWLNRDIQTPEPLMPLLKPWPPEQMDMYPVSKAVGSVRNDDPSLIERLAPEPTAEAIEQLKLW